jgi:SAM-dependent methyltransferase
MIRDAHYRAKLVHRARGLAELDRRIGGIVADIDERLARQEVVRVLELGCGYGTALLELRARYGGRVELHGMNRLEGDGDRDILLRNAAERGVVVDDADPTRALPSLSYGDVASGLPFADDTFDVIVSQVAWLYFRNKIGVVRDVLRVLKPDGIAKIDADEIDPGLPPEYARLVEIWDARRLVPFGEYLRRYGLGFAPAQEGEYLRLEKRAGVGDDLAPIFEIDTSRVHAHFDGVKCVYACVPGVATTPSATSASIAASS